MKIFNRYGLVCALFSNALSADDLLPYSMGELHNRLLDNIMVPVADVTSKIKMDYISKVDRFKEVANATCNEVNEPANLFESNNQCTEFIFKAFMTHADSSLLLENNRPDNSIFYKSIEKNQSINDFDREILFDAISFVNKKDVNFIQLNQKIDELKDKILTENTDESESRSATFNSLDVLQYSLLYWTNKQTDLGGGQSICFRQCTGSGSSGTVTKEERNQIIASDMQGAIDGAATGSSFGLTGKYLATYALAVAVAYSTERAYYAIKY